MAAPKLTPCIGCGDPWPKDQLDIDGCCGHCSQQQWLPSRVETLRADIAKLAAKGPLPDPLLVDPKALTKLFAEHDDLLALHDAERQSHQKMLNHNQEVALRLIRQRDYAVTLLKYRANAGYNALHEIPAPALPLEDHWPGMP